MRAEVVVERQTVLYSKRGPVARVLLNRPEVINAYNLRMRDELFETMEAVRDDPDVRVVLLGGAGSRGFCAGADLTEFGSAPSQVIARSVRWERDVWGLFLQIEKPLVVALHGHVIGSGVEIACLCDVRIAADDALFRMPEVALGMVPAAGGTQTLPRAVGVGSALETLLTGRAIPRRGGAGPGPRAPGGPETRSGRDGGPSRAADSRPCAGGRVRRQVGAPIRYADAPGRRTRPRKASGGPAFQGAPRSSPVNTTELLAISSAIVPHRPAIVFEGRTMTYADLHARVDRLANALAELGLTAGDRVAMLQVNSPEHVETYFAAAKLDAVYVPLNFRSRAGELRQVIDDARPRVLIVGRQYVDVARELMDGVESLERCVALEAPVAGWSFYDEMIASASDEERFPQADGGDSHRHHVHRRDHRASQGRDAGPRLLLVLCVVQRRSRRPGGRRAQHTDGPHVPRRRTAGVDGRRLRRAHPGDTTAVPAEGVDVPGGVGAGGQGHGGSDHAQDAHGPPGLS